MNDIPTVKRIYYSEHDNRFIKITHIHGNLIGYLDLLTLKTGEFSLYSTYQLMLRELTPIEESNYYDL